jgi:hypothetical protein
MVSDTRVVTSSEVAELLRRAKAEAVPPERLRDLADAMTMMGARYCYARRQQDDTPKPDTVWHHAQRAANRLRAAVGQIIAVHIVWAEIYRHAGLLDRATEQEAEATRHKQFLDQLPEFAPPIPKDPLWPNPKTGKRLVAWHSEARLLLQLYRGAVKQGAGVWRDGPGVRFIKLALERCGLGEHEERTIEKALE